MNINNDIKFLIHGEALRHQVKKHVRLHDDNVARFHQIITFQIGPHYVVMQPRKNPDHQWLATQFIMTREEVESITNE